MSTSVTGELRTLGTPQRTISDRMIEATAWLAHHPIPHPHLPRPHYDNNADHLEPARIVSEMGRL